MRDYAEGASRSRLLLLGIDGLVWEKVAAETAPHLWELHGQGTFHTMQMEVPTMSGPGWSTILTGRTHAEHGVVSNSFTGHQLFHHPDLLSRAFYADQSTTTFAAAGWPPLVDPAGLGPVVHERREQQLAGLHKVAVRDGETYGYHRADSEVSDLTDLALRSTHAFDVGFVYFCTVDDAGHLYGTEGPEYTAAITLVDGWVGRVAQRLQARADQGERWLLTVVTDHGHVPEGGHGGATDRERASFVLPVGFGRPGVEWTPTVEPQQVCDLLLAEIVPAPRPAPRQSA